MNKLHSGTAPLVLEGDRQWAYLQGANLVWDRHAEAMLVDAVVDAVAQQRAPMSDREADVYRFSAQLLKTRYRPAADFLDGAARDFYGRARILPRSFPQVVADGLVSDVSRLRHLLENRMAGVRAW
jgi:hypothetical protein